MSNKEQLRRKYYNIRKNRYFEVTNNFFRPLIGLLDKLFKKKSIYLSFYYPSNYEVNVINFYDLIKRKKKHKSFNANY